VRVSKKKNSLKRRKSNKDTAMLVAQATEEPQRCGHDDVPA
jgi:hypothetical protein